MSSGRMNLEHTGHFKPAPKNIYQYRVQRNPMFLGRKKNAQILPYNTLLTACEGMTSATGSLRHVPMMIPMAKGPSPGVVTFTLCLPTLPTCLVIPSLAHCFIQNPRRLSSIDAPLPGQQPGQHPFWYFPGYFQLHLQKKVSYWNWIFITDSNIRTDSVNFLVMIFVNF